MDFSAARKKRKERKERKNQTSVRTEPLTSLPSSNKSQQILMHSVCVCVCELGGERGRHLKDIKMLKDE